MFSSHSASTRQSDSRAAGPTIAVEDLRVGMFIHLDGGWLSHPFALSSFRIANTQQITTLRGLKLERVRWSPELSEGEAETDGASAQVAAADPSATPGAAAIGLASASVREAGSATTRRWAALVGQRETQRQCEQQFAEATSAWRQASALLAADPEAARAGVDVLAHSLTEKLMVDGDVGIRLLPVSGNDRAATHALNVTVVAMLLARSLGVAREDLAELALGSLLHDIGKLDLPERVRHAEAACSSADVQAYREHVGRGMAAARRMGLPEGALTVIAQHHEHADGSGFPQRVGGDRITLAGRIVAIVNRYDNLCNPATPTPPLTPHEAVATLFAHGRTRYDAAVLNAFIRMMGVYPAGSLVQLTDERYAMVVSVNSSHPLKPRVLVHEIKMPRSEALLLNLEQEPDLGIRRSLTASKMPVAALEYLDPRPRVAYFFEPLAGAGAHAEAAPEAAAAA